VVLEVEGITEKLRQEISSIKNKAKKDYRENKWVTKKYSNSNMSFFLELKFV